MIKFVLIGCGAVSEILYRPAFEYISKKGSGKLVAVVDTNLQRAREYAAPFGAKAFNSLDEALSASGLDAAVVAVPHVFHAPIAIQCLTAGLAVLCEKPMAISSAECDQMIETARNMKRPLVIGLFRRYFPSTQAIKNIIDKQTLGRVKSFEFLEGEKYSWPAKTTSFFSKNLAGGGVLIDAGAHLVDLMLWWFGDVADVQYSDDSMGGVEANCELHLQMKSGVHGRVRMSREYPLPNQYIIHCEQGDLIYKCDVVDRIFIKENGTSNVKEINLRKDVELIGDRPELSLQHRFEFIDCFFAQLENFCSVVKDSATPAVTPEEAKKGVELIDKCYSSRTLMKMPWLHEVEHLRAKAFASEPGNQVHKLNSANKPRVAVVGAGGFIGYRLCEWLLLHDYTYVTPVIHSAKSFALLARFNIKAEFADVLDQKSLEQAFKGKEIVFHAAVGDHRTIVNGIENTIRAAKSAGVKRIVYLSTACVYGNAPPSGTNDESPPLKNQQFAYNNAKVAAEEVVEKFRNELSMDIVIIRPSIVWGPRSQYWIVDIIKSLQEGSAYLLDGGRGICNTVYIDNLVEALWLAATKSTAKNQNFIITDDEIITWQDVYSGIAQKIRINGQPWFNISIEDAEQRLVKAERMAKFNAWRSLILRSVSKIMPTISKRAAMKVYNYLFVHSHSTEGGVKKMPILDREIVSLQSGKCKLSSEKAKQLIGYTPSTSFVEGMASTFEWLQFIELINYEK